jgi:heat shock protein HspQ
MVATKQSELNELARIGAVPQKNSGRGHHKGDGILGDYLVDVKEVNKSFGLTKDSWAKVCTDAVSENKAPILHIVIGEGNERVRVWVMEESAGRDLLEYKAECERKE